jgi:exodeoxyribonuclease-3
MLTYKLEFYDKLIDYANKITQSGKDIILTGDFNICHTEIDIARPKENEDSIGFLPVERAKV